MAVWHVLLLEHSFHLDSRGDDRCPQSKTAYLRPKLPAIKGGQLSRYNNVEYSLSKTEAPQQKPQTLAGAHPTQLPVHAGTLRGQVSLHPSMVMSKVSNASPGIPDKGRLLICAEDKRRSCKVDDHCPSRKSTRLEIERTPTSGLESANPKGKGRRRQRRRWLHARAYCQVSVWLGSARWKYF